MRVEIITIISRNYGNRLQNYALQKCLEKMGVSVRTSRRSHYKHPFLRIVRNCFLKLYRKSDSDLYNYFDTKIKWKSDLLPNVCHDEKIDYYIAGSDQIWNPLFEFNSEREFLNFVPKEKRIAYAGSIGIDELPEHIKEKYRTYFLEFKNISVREHAAKKIIKEICELEVQVVLDPTLLLDAEEWKKITRTSVLNIKEQYIVKYFLGIRNDKYDKLIEEYARVHSCRIIDITRHRECGIPGIGPDEFVTLIRNCKVAFLDSFHGMVFSIIFRKQFLVFNRPDESGYGNMNSRFDSILKLFQLENRYVNSSDDIKNIDEKIDYDAVHHILEIEREKSEKYLRNMLSL